MTDNIQIIKKEKCCACYACVNICPKKCIHMEKDSTGSIYPRIDVTKCETCNRCKEVCPVLNPVELNKIQECFVAYSKNQLVRNESSSGGVATELSRLIIEQGGIVYGVASIGKEVKYGRIDKFSDLEKIQGSKYVHSHIGDCFQLMKRDLKSGRVVLMIGLPCQIAGARSYFLNKYSNLYLVDILCHGAPAQDTFEKTISFETNRMLTRVSFRDGNKYCLTGYNRDGEVFKSPYRANYWFNAFVEGYIFRENCYSCRYAGITRCGDITLGDFWGIGKRHAFYGEPEKGVNIVTVNTQQGWEIWHDVCGKVVYESRDIQEAIPYNHSLQRPATRPNNYSRYIELCAKKGTKKALLQAYINKTVFISLRRIIRKSRTVYSIITAIPILGNKLKEYPD